MVFENDNCFISSDVWKQKVFESGEVFNEKKCFNEAGFNLNTSDWELF